MSLPPREPEILCAAIWVDDGKFHPHQPANVSTGVVFGGFRHCSIFQQINGMEGKQVQGFLASDNRFVDREVGALIAYRAGQIAHKKPKLFSEDLY